MMPGQQNTQTAPAGQRTPFGQAQSQSPQPQGTPYNPQQGMNFAAWQGGGQNTQSFGMDPGQRDQAMAAWAQPKQQLLQWGQNLPQFAQYQPQQGADAQQLGARNSALVQQINNAGASQQVGTYLGQGAPPADWGNMQLNQQQMLRNADQMVNQGFQNPFAMQPPPPRDNASAIRNLLQGYGIPQNVMDQIGGMFGGQQGGSTMPPDPPGTPPGVGGYGGQPSGPNGEPPGTGPNGEPPGSGYWSLGGGFGGRPGGWVDTSGPGPHGRFVGGRPGPGPGQQGGPGQAQPAQDPYATATPYSPQEHREAYEQQRTEAANAQTREGLIRNLGFQPQSNPSRSEMIRALAARPNALVIDQARQVGVLTADEAAQLTKEQELASWKKTQRGFEQRQPWATGGGPLFYERGAFVDPNLAANQEAGRARDYDLEHGLTAALPKRTEYADFLMQRGVSSEEANRLAAEQYPTRTYQDRLAQHQTTLEGFRQERTALHDSRFSDKAAYEGVAKEFHKVAAAEGRYSPRAQELLQQMNSLLKPVDQAAADDLARRTNEYSEKFFVEEHGMTTKQAQEQAKRHQQSLDQARAQNKKRR